MRKRIPYLKKPKKGAFVKRYVKFLAVCKDPTTSKAALRAAPDQVVKHIQYVMLLLMPTKEI